MDKRIISFIACIATINSVQAATVVTGVGLNPGMRLQDAITGSFITTTVQYAVGTFTSLPAADATLAQIRASFKEFARTTAAADAAGTRITNGTGMTAIGNAVPGTSATDFNTRQIYVVVGNTPSLDDATQWAVYTGQTVSGTNWLFPADVTGATSVNAVAGNAGAINTLIGTETDNASGADFLRLATTIPEPGVSILALASLGLLARRRRN